MRPRTPSPPRGCCCPGRRSSACASTSAPPPPPQPASSGEQNGKHDTSHCAIRSSSAALELGRGRSRRPAADDLAALRDEDDEPRLARRVVEPDPLVRHRDRMAEVELVGVLRARRRRRPRRRSRRPRRRRRSRRPPPPRRGGSSRQRSQKLAVKTSRSGRSAHSSEPRIGRAVDELGRRSRAPAGRRRAARRTRRRRAPARAGRRRRPRPRRRRRSRPARGAARAT